MRQAAGGATPAGPRVPGAGGLRMVAVAVAMTTAFTLPAFLLGALAVQVRTDLGFSEAQLGGLVTAFFAASAASSTPGGWIVERLGTYRSILVATTISAGALAAIGALGHSWWVLVACVAVSGLANGAGQPATNALLASGIRQGRQGLAFGIKQGAVPAASLLGGLAVPAIGLTIGWRWAFAAAVLLPLSALALAPRSGVGARRRVEGRARPDSPLRRLVMVATITGVGTAAATAIAAFLVEWSVRSGIAPSIAGLLLAAASALGVASRVGTGWWADRSSRNLFHVVGGMLALGAVGCLLLLTGNGVALAVGALLGIGAGWGWNGMLVYGVVRQNPSAPAAATGVTQTGLYLGGMVGPTTFGLLVQHVGYPAAWLFAALLMAVGAMLAFEVGRARRAQREPPLAPAAGTL